MYEGSEMTQNGLFEEIVIAGFGGQGIILAGKLLAQTAMNSGKEVTYMPSYGAEMRGGTANSSVIIAEAPIASPMVSKPSSAIIMNKASLTKFGPRLKKNGLIILNESLVDTEPETDDSVTIIKIPADDIAVELGNQKCANMVMLGAYVRSGNFLSIDTMKKSLPQVLAKRYHSTLPVNETAIEKGAAFAEKSLIAKR